MEPVRISPPPPHTHTHNSSGHCVNTQLSRSPQTAFHRAWRYILGVFFVFFFPFKPPPQSAECPHSASAAVTRGFKTYMSVISPTTPDSTCLLPEPQKTNSSPQIHSPPRKKKKKSPPNIDPLRIVRRCLPLSKKEKKKEKNTEKTKPTIARYRTMCGFYSYKFRFFLLFFLLLFSPDITCHYLSGEWQILTARGKSTEAYSQSKEEEKVLTCGFAAILPILFFTLEEVCKYPWIEPGRNSRFLCCFLFFPPSFLFSLFFFYPERWADQNAGFLFPPLSFKTDVNGPGRVAPPASLLVKSATRRTAQLLFLPFKWKRLRWYVSPGLLLWRFRRCVPGGCLWVFLGALAHPHLHPLEWGGGTHTHTHTHTAASAAEAAAPHWGGGGRPQRHAPLRLEKATSPLGEEDGRAMLDGCSWRHSTYLCPVVAPDSQWTFWKPPPKKTNKQKKKKERKKERGKKENRNMTVNVIIKTWSIEDNQTSGWFQEKKKKKGHLQQLKSQEEMEWTCALKSNKTNHTFCWSRRRSELPPVMILKMTAPALSWT